MFVFSGRGSSFLNANIVIFVRGGGTGTSSLGDALKLGSLALSRGWESIPGCAASRGGYVQSSVNGFLRSPS